MTAANIGYNQMNFNQMLPICTLIYMYIWFIMPGWALMVYYWNMFSWSLQINHWYTREVYMQKIHGSHCNYLALYVRFC